VAVDRKIIADDNAADHFLKTTKPAVGLMMRSRQLGGDLASTPLCPVQENQIRTLSGTTWETVLF
jgi:hypothetical protein